MRAFGVHSIRVKGLESRGLKVWSSRLRVQGLGFSGWEYDSGFGRSLDFFWLNPYPKGPWTQITRL